MTNNRKKQTRSNVIKISQRRQRKPSPFKTKTKKQVAYNKNNTLHRLGINAPQNIATNQETQFPHFRHYKKANHPALITGEQVNEKKVEEWKYRKVMHSEKDGRHPNEKVYPNPNPQDKKPMYIGKRTKHDEKKYFSESAYPWKYKK